MWVVKWVGVKWVFGPSVYVCGQCVAKVCGQCVAKVYGQCLYACVA